MIRRIVFYPVHAVAAFIPHKERVLIVSVLFMAGGPLVATLDVKFIPHLLLDSVGYMLHALGCAPLVERYLGKVGRPQ